MREQRWREIRVAAQRLVKKVDCTLLKVQVAELGCDCHEHRY